MYDKKLESLAYRLNDLNSLRNLFSELNFDFADRPVNKDNWNEKQKKMVKESRVIAIKNGYRIYYIKIDTDSLNQLEDIATKIIKDERGFCMICSHNPRGFKWTFSSLSKEFSKKFSETRHISIDIKSDTGVSKNFVDFLEKIRVDKNLSTSSIISRISDAFDFFAVLIRDDLTINVFEALKILSEGIISDKSNNFIMDEQTIEKIREPTFILLYRIMFVLYAEDRMVFPDNKFYHDNFSLKWIKANWILESDQNIAEHQVNERLKKLFRLIEMGSIDLNYDPKEFFMRSYYGRLFDRNIHSNLEKMNIPNKSLLDTISLLTRTKDKKGNYFFLDYATLETRHLGSIYEHLLEFHLIVQDNKIVNLPDPKYRKLIGSYYTPEYIVDQIIKNTVEPLIDDIIKQTNDPSEQIDNILALNILDPAMGSGHFLVGTINYIARRICEIEYKDNDITKQAFIEKKRDVARRCIYGVDINSLAVDLASVSLWLETLSSEKPLSFLDAHLKHGNSLIGSSINDILEKQTTIIESVKSRTDFKKTIRDFIMLETLDDDTPQAVKAKVIKYANMQSQGTIYYHLKFLLNRKLAQSFDVDVPPINDYIAKMGEDGLDFYAENSPWSSIKEIADTNVFFHWDLEFPDIFYEEDGKRSKNPGFDAVIGNPPYIEVKKINNHLKPYMYKRFQYKNQKILKGRFDIFWAFIILGVDIIKKNGKLGLLVEDSILDSISGDILRKFILDKTTVLKFVYMGKFPTANVHTVITLLTNTKKDNYEFPIENWTNGRSHMLTKQNILSKHKQIINLNLTVGDSNDKLISKIEKNSEKLENIIFLQQGIIVQWGSGKTLQKRKDECVHNVKKNQYVPYIEGKDVARYRFPDEHKWLDYQPNKHHRPRMKEVFSRSKLLIRRIASEPLICLLDNGYYFVDNTLFTGTRYIDLKSIKKKYPMQITKIVNKLDYNWEELLNTSQKFNYGYLLAILNSKLMAYYFNYKFKTKSLDVITKCKIRKIEYSVQKEISNLATTLQKYITEFYATQKNMINQIHNNCDYKFKSQIIFNPKQFLTIIKEQKFELLFNDKNGLKTYIKNKNKLFEIYNTISNTDDKINRIIYDIYELDNEEIKIIERTK